MPIAVWYKIEESNDLKYMLKKPRKIDGVERIFLYAAWQKITDEFIDEFGLSDELKDIMLIKSKIRILEIDQELTGMSNETFIDIEKMQLEQMSKAGKKQSSAEITAYIEKYLKFPIDEEKTTVIKYFSYIRMMRKENKAKQQQNSNGKED